MLLTPLMNGQAFLRPHTHTRHKPDSQSNPGRPSEQALAGARHGGGQWAHPRRRAHGGHTLSTQASPLTLSGQASVCFPFKSTTERTPTCFLNKAGITGLWKVCQTLKAYDVCVCACDLQLCFFHFSFIAAENWSHADKHQGENKNHNVNELRDPPFWTQSA